MTDIKLEDDPKSNWHPYNSDQQGLINKLEIQKSDLSRNQKVISHLRNEIEELQEKLKSKKSVVSVRNIAVARAVLRTFSGSMAAYFHYANNAKWGSLFSLPVLRWGIVLTAAVCIGAGGQQLVALHLEGKTMGFLIGDPDDSRADGKPHTQEYELKEVFLVDDPAPKNVKLSDFVRDIVKEVLKELNLIPDDSQKSGLPTKKENK